MVSDEQLTHLLSTFLEKCQPLDKWGTEKELKEVADHNKGVMRNHMGFLVERRKSQVSKDAGTGVFVTEGVAPKGSVVGESSAQEQNPF